MISSKFKGVCVCKGAGAVAEAGGCFNFCLNLTENTSGLRPGRVSLCGFDSLCFCEGAFGYLTDKFLAAASYILVNLSKGSCLLQLVPVLLPSHVHKSF